MPSPRCQSPEAVLGGGLAASGLLVLVIGSCLARGTTLVAVVLVGLFLLALGVGVLMIALPPRSREEEPAQAAPTPLRACPPVKPQPPVEAVAPVPETQSDNEPSPGKAETAANAPAPEKRRCSALTKSGTQCRMVTDDLTGLCHVHRG